MTTTMKRELELSTTPFCVNYDLSLGSSEILPGYVPEQHGLGWHQVQMIWIERVSVLRMRGYYPVMTGLELVEVIKAEGRKAVDAWVMRALLESRYQHLIPDWWERSPTLFLGTLVKDTDWRNKTIWGYRLERNTHLGWVERYQKMNAPVPQGAHVAFWCQNPQKE